MLTREEAELAELGVAVDLRHAILAYVQRKLDEAKADIHRREMDADRAVVMARRERDNLRTELVVAKADGELLGKVGWLLPRRGQIEIRLDEDGDWYARSVLIEHPASVRHSGGAPTLAEALRKLVESDS